MRLSPRRPLACAAAAAVALGALTGLTLSTAAPASAAAQVFAVPTPEAGLGRIVASPTGDVWFVEEDAQQVGRITPQGQVLEYDVSLGNDYAKAKDLDVAPDGSVWVIADSGEYAGHLDRNGSALSAPRIGRPGDCIDNSCPFGEQVRVAPDGRAWVTMSYNRQFASVVTDAGRTDVPNAPPCQGPLGEAADGSMWCSNNGSLFHLPGNAGIPVGVYASWPTAMTAGPVGDIWFATAQSNGFLSPSDGYVGYLTGLTPVRFNTGSRTAPSDLVRGPDNQMWFASTGAAKGIGHLNAAGQGALTQVGGYEPESLTFGADGAVWFTDETNNVVVKVPTSDLQVTNVDPGAGSVFRPGQGAAPAVPAVTGKKTLALEKGKVALQLTCAAAGPCTGKVGLTTAAKVRKPGKATKSKKGKKPTKAYAAITRQSAFAIAPGATATVKLKVTGAGNGRLKRRGATKVRVALGDATLAKVKIKIKR